MSSFLLDHDFSSYYQSSDIEFLWHYIKDIILSFISLYTPVIKKRSHHQPPWFTSSIWHQLHRVHSLRTKCKHNPSPHNASILSAAESTLHTDISTARVAFESLLVDTFAYSKDSKIYDYIRIFSKSGGIPSVLQYQSQTLTAATDKANAFNDFFHSVFNSSCMDVALTDLPFPATSLCSISITMEDTFAVLATLDPSKAMGGDGIPPIVLQQCAAALVEPVHHLFSHAVFVTVILTYKVAYPQHYPYS